MAPINICSTVQTRLPRTKRHHRKSRSGCSSCKRRRVKCDEVKPVCSICRHKGLRCVYETKVRTVGSTATGRLWPPSTRPNTPPSPLQYPPSPRSLQVHSSHTPSPLSLKDETNEFRLAQTYLEHVADSFSASCSSTTQTWIWHVLVPAQAFVSTTVRHGMLTAAAMYLYLRSRDRRETPDSTLIDIATSHGNAFVERSRVELHDLVSSNANANVASSRLLFVLALAFYRYRRADGGDQEMVSWTWLHLLKGVATVHSSLVATGQALHLNIREDMTSEYDTSQSAESPGIDATQLLSPQAGHADLLLYLSRTRHARMATLRFAHSQGWLGGDGAEADISAVIDHLSDITARIDAGRYTSLFRVIFSWAATLPDAIVRLLTSKHPGILAIYTHWLMLLTLVDDLWWVGDMGRVGISAVLQILGETENDLAPVLSWPKEILQLH